VDGATLKALILFGHGARDPRWKQPFLRIQAMLAAQQPDVAVHLAFLEFMKPDLPELVAQLVAASCLDIRLVPVFLGQGGHVLRDLPQLIEQLRSEYPGLQLQCSPAVGEDEAVLAAIVGYCMKTLA
jgi:sirohydrochlorin cobaltochelatase